MDSSPLPAVSAPLAAGNAQPVMASRGCWRWDSPTLPRVCVRWDWSVRWSSPTARPGACPFGPPPPPLSYQIAWGESVFRAGRKNPLDYASCGNPASLSESLGFVGQGTLSGSVHSQAVFTAANGPREIPSFPCGILQSACLPAMPRAMAPTSPGTVTRRIGLAPAICTMPYSPTSGRRSGSASVTTGGT